MGFTMDNIDPVKKNDLEKPKVKKTEPNAKVIETETLEPLRDFTKDDSVPVYQVREVLPSEGKLYPLGIDTVITYDPYTWAGMRKLNSSDMPTRQLWEFILSGIHTDKTLPKLKLTIPDFYFLAFKRKLASVGFGKFSVEVDCYNDLPDTGQACKEKNIFEIEDKEIEFDNMELTREEFPAYLQIDENIELELSPTTVQDAFILMNKNKFSDPIAQYAIQVRNMKFDEAYEILSSDKMDAVIGSDLDDIINKFYHRVKPIVKKCKCCGQAVAIILDMGGTIIKPFRQPDNTKRLRVRFGKVEQ